MKFGTRWPPVPAGILIGISMLLAWLVAGRGVGASGGMTRFVAWVQHGLFPAATEQSAYFGSYFADGAHPLYDYVVFLLVGIGRMIDAGQLGWLAERYFVMLSRHAAFDEAFRPRPAGSRGASWP